MKTQEELNALKEEVETVNRKLEELNRKLAELTEEELAQVSGGISNEGGLVIPTIVLDKKGNVVNFKIDVPAAEEADVVELNIAKVELPQGGVIKPTEIEADFGA